MKFWHVAIFAATLLAGCTSAQDDPNFVSVEGDDEAMVAAIEKAKATFHLFEKNWKSMPNDGYSVKFAVPTGRDAEEVEHIWFNPIRIEGDEITAECSNEPVNVLNLKYGEIRTLDRSTISDWMIAVGKQCYGGYTIRVLSEKDPQNAPPLEFVDFEE